MKKISKLLYMLAALPLMMTSCVEEIVREPGVQDLEDCYGVYFKELSKADANVELDPKDPTEVVLTALRPNSEDLADLPAITVPVEVQSPVTESGEKLFKLTEIKFEEGQIETKFTVTFPEAEMGVPYKCVIEIKDRQYASLYSKNPAVVSFTVTRVKWVPLKGADGELYGTYREGIISDLYGFPHVVVPIEIYERADKKGYYRIANLYSKDLMAAMLGVTPDDVAELVSPSMVYLDCTDPKKVVWEHSPIGVDLTAAGADIVGPLGVGSFCDRYLNIKPDQNLYGTMKDGVIKFPMKGLFLSCPDGIYYGNMSGNVRFVLPGCRDVDFSLATSSGVSEDGILPVMIKKGPDVTTVKYAISEGALNDKASASFAKKIASGEIAGTEVKFEKGPVAQIGVSLEKTGVYTVVFAGIDADGKTLVSAAGEVISYVAKGDSRPVVGNAGLIVSDKYAGEGKTAENSMEIYIYGDGIVSAQMGLYKKSVVDTNLKGVLSDLQKNSLDSDVIKEINNGGWSVVVDKLLKGTEYVLLCNLSNAYEEKLIVEVAKTEGVADPLQAIYSVDMLYTGEKAEYLKNKDWALYQFAKNGRINSGTVSLVDGGTMETQNGVLNLINMEGLWTPILEANGLAIENDVTLWDCYEGVLYHTPSYYGKCLLQGETFYAGLVGDINGEPMALGNAYIGGFTEQGNIAFIDSGIYEQAGYGPVSGLGLYLFSGPTYEEVAFKLSSIHDFLLVHPDNVPSKEEAAPTKAVLQSVRKHLAAELNGVEDMNYQFRKAIHKAISEKKLSQGRMTDIHPELQGMPVEHQSVEISDFEIRAEKCNATLK